MPLIEYVKQKFSRSSRIIIDQANAIIKEYLDQGYSLTLRQLYYQFVSRDFIANSQTEYKRLGSVINLARLGGLIDWDSIEDRTRNLMSLSHWDHPRDIVNSCADQFRLDMWEYQKYRPEVWIEKDALTGVIQGVCQKYDIPYFSCRGYNSQSEMWNSSMRMRGHINTKQAPYILHFGDHDPSGIDMSRDILNRLDIFHIHDFEFERMALNMDQVRKYKPPPNPAKITDSRYEGYIKKYGKNSWELDALEPKVIVGLIESKVKTLINQKKWRERRDLQQEYRDDLSKIADTI